VTDAFGKIGEGFANQKSAYSPGMFQPQKINMPVIAPYKYKFGATTDADLRGRMYSGTDFSNPAQRRF
jgi:hypothetical protein